MRLIVASLILVCTGLGMIGPSRAVAQDKPPTAVGLWQHSDDSGKPIGWFRIVEKGGIYQGQIVKMYAKPGEDPTTFRCTKCEGARKDAPVLGITFIDGMQRNGLAYENGTILDPRDGSVYRALMQLSPDNKQLTVRGYLGVSLFGMSQVWVRLPDNALDPGLTASKREKRQPKAGSPPAAPAR